MFSVTIKPTHNTNSKTNYLNSILKDIIIIMKYT